MPPVPPTSELCVKLWSYTVISCSIIRTGSTEQAGVRMLCCPISFLFRQGLLLLMFFINANYKADIKIAI